MTRARDAGYVTLFVLGVSMGMAALIGLVLDGGRAQRAQSDCFGVAAAASRAGAQELDASAAVAGEVRLDETLASQAASSYLAEHGVDGTVSVADREVTVTAVRYVDYLMLPGGITLDATATSRVTQERAP
ncbi:MAG TPA: pilus assembly protein TadG-related protein [Acidimicrobiales bacterium]|nr:pilus assembly protein TadG-related protein [Acidimicrobiales bacterium]